MAPRLSCCDRYAMFRLLSVILPGLILVLLASWGSYEAHKDSKCDMSFMRPVFIRLNFTTPTAEQAALNSTVPFVSGYAYKYRLFRYMDGYGEHSSLLGGYPVLFLPGNRGSHQQARSIGSALGFMSGKLAVADVFTVDFNEEATAGFGDLFWEQATFVNDAVATIRSLYQKEFASTNVNVTIIGHSMGGLVARAVPMLKRYVPGSISNIITLSSPHQRLPLPFDPALVNSLKSINDFWKLAMEKPVESKDERSSPAEKVKAALAVRVDNTARESESFDVGPAGEALSAAVINDTDLGSNRTVPGPTIPTAGHPFHILKGTALFSVTGGLRDLQVASSATSVKGLVPYWKSAWLSTEDVHVCMCAADHLSILWCRQFVDELAKAVISVGVQCGGIDYDETQLSHVSWIKPITSCTPPGRVKYTRSMLIAPAGHVDNQLEFWHPSVDVAVVVASVVAEAAPFAVTTMLFVVSALVFVRLIMYQRLSDSVTGSATRALAHCLLPWNHLPLLAWVWVLLATPMKSLLRWYLRALRTNGTQLDAALAQRLTPTTIWAGVFKSVRISATVLVLAKLVLSFLAANLPSSSCPEAVTAIVVWVSGIVNGTCTLIASSVVTLLRYSLLTTTFPWATLAAMYWLSLFTIAILSLLVLLTSKLFAICCRTSSERSDPASCRTPLIAVTVIVSLVGAASYSLTRSLAMALASMAVANLSIITSGLLRACLFPNAYYRSSSPLHIMLCFMILSSFGGMIGLFRQTYSVFAHYWANDSLQTFYSSSAKESMLFKFNGVLLPMAVLLWWFPRNSAIPDVWLETSKITFSVLNNTLEWVSWQGLKFASGASTPPKLDVPANKHALVGSVAHASCLVCLHEDGGPQAQYEETDGKDVVVVSKMVQVGPTFRVVACNCAFTCELAGDMCQFCLCKCKACGGSHYRRPVARNVACMDDSSDSEGDPAPEPILGRSAPRKPSTLAVLAVVRQWLPLLLCAIVTFTVLNLMDSPHVMPACVALVCTVLLGASWQK